MRLPKVRHKRQVSLRLPLSANASYRANEDAPAPTGRCRQTLRAWKCKKVVFWLQFDFLPEDMHAVSASTNILQHDTHVRNHIVASAARGRNGDGL